MNKGKIAFSILYLLCFIAVFLVIIVFSSNRFLNILLAIGLLVLTMIFNYVNHTKRKDDSDD